MNDFRILSANGIEQQKGSVEIAMGGFIVTIHRRGRIASIALTTKALGPKAALRRWAQVTPATIMQALREATRHAAIESAREVSGA